MGMGMGPRPVLLTHWSLLISPTPKPPRFSTSFDPSCDGKVDEAPIVVALKRVQTLMPRRPIPRFSWDLSLPGAKVTPNADLIPSGAGFTDGERLALPLWSDSHGLLWFLWGAQAASDNSADGTAIAALRLDTSLRRSLSIFFAGCFLVYACDRVSILLRGGCDDLNLVLGMA